jgi:hypothetical protein
VVGFADETWWSRLAQPTVHTWCADGEPLRLHEVTLAPDDPDPPALACYGLLTRTVQPAGGWEEAMWLRFVEGRPVSGVTTQFLAWCCTKLAAQGKRALLLVWDNASWHSSQAVRDWLRAHNWQVKREGQGVRIVVCPLPVKSPWLNPIEAKWPHGKRKVLEADRVLPARDLAGRVCAAFGCPYEEHLTIPKMVA